MQFVDTGWLLSVKLLVVWLTEGSVDHWEDFQLVQGDFSLSIQASFRSEWL
mgnify:CR=1 FL=1